MNASNNDYRVASGVSRVLVLLSTGAPGTTSCISTAGSASSNGANVVIRLIDDIRTIDSCDSTLLIPNFEPP